MSLNAQKGIPVRGGRDDNPLLDGPSTTAMIVTLLPGLIAGLISGKLKTAPGWDSRQLENKERGAKMRRTSIASAWVRGWEEGRLKRLNFKAK